MQEASVLPLSMFATEIEISHSGSLCTGCFFFTGRLCICYASSVAWCFVSINFEGNPVRCSRCNMHPRMWQLPSLLNYHLCHRGRPRKIQKYEMQKCKIQSTKIQENKNSKYGSIVSFFSTLLPPGQTSYKTLPITTSATTCIHLYGHLNVCLVVDCRMPTFSRGARLCKMQVIVRYLTTIERCVGLATKYITLTTFFHRSVIIFYSIS